MFHALPPRMQSDSPAPLSDLAKDIAMEDWDLLFDAVILRLLSSFDGLPPDNPAPRRMAWWQTRARVMDCVQALDQLHLAAAHELARMHPPAVNGPPSAVAPQTSLTAADLPPMHDDVLRAIWQVWYENLCARAGLSPISGPPSRLPR